MRIGPEDGDETVRDGRDTGEEEESEEEVRQDDEQGVGCQGLRHAGKFGHTSLYPKLWRLFCWPSCRTYIGVPTDSILPFSALTFPSHLPAKHSITNVNTAHSRRCSH